MTPKKPAAHRVRPGANTGCPCCFIIPAHILRGIVDNAEEKESGHAFSTLLSSHRVRGQRDTLAAMGAVALTTPAGEKRRTIYSAARQPNVPGTIVRGEGAKATKDTMVNEAYNHSGTVYDFFSKVYDRNSIDDRGMRLDSTVYYREDPTDTFENAFWNGTQMIYGEGDGKIFTRFTKCLDVIGHELTHGITQYEAGLLTYGQSGALNESFADVFGSLIKQWKKKQTAAKADWLVGVGMFTKRINGVALRSLKEPGYAYDDERLGGEDPQPAHMDDYVKLPNTKPGDYGGVHINSGIPNHAFYLAASEIGGYAWERAGRIWYDALCNRIRSNSTFKTAAQATLASATTLYGGKSKEYRAVKAAWREVGVL